MSYGKNIFYLLFSWTLLLNSCSIVEPSPPAASFIHIDSIPVSSDYPTQGSNSNKVTDAWVIYDNAFLGTFPLPADFPVLGTGSHHIQVKAGIIENGISSIRSAYPKYSLFDTTITLIANQKITLIPRVTYNTGVGFAQIEDFDDASLSLTSTNVNYAQLAVTQSGDPDVFENNSGRALIDDNHPVFEVASSTAFPLPLTVPTYLELNYKCENDFVIGVFISTTSGVVKSPLLTVKANSEWKKIYVSLSDLGGVQTSGLEYKVYLRADKSNTISSANLLFDNLKVVY